MRVPRRDPNLATNEQLQLPFRERMALARENRELVAETMEHGFRCGPDAETPGDKYALFRPDFSMLQWVTQMLPMPPVTRPETAEEWEEAVASGFAATRENPCGTACCGAGHTYLLVAHLRGEDPRFIAAADSQKCLRAASRFLYLQPAEAEKLFVPPNDVCDVATWVDFVRAMRDFAAGNVFPWSLAPRSAL